MANWRSDHRYRLLTAAAELCHDRGFAAVRLREVAAAAGVPSGSLTHHFPTRRSLLQAVAQHVRDERMVMLENLAARHAEPHRRLNALVAHLVERTFEDRDRGCPSARLFMNLDTATRFEERRTSDLLRQGMLCIEEFVHWELRAAGIGEREARRAAMHFLALWQGAGLRTLAGGTDSDAGHVLHDWLESVLGELVP